jgi:hypothetical protein
VVRNPPDFIPKTFDFYTIEASGNVTVPAVVSAQVAGLTFYSYPISADITPIVTDNNGMVVGTTGAHVSPPTIVAQTPLPPTQLAWSFKWNSNICGSSLDGCLAARPSIFQGLNVSFLGGNLPNELVGGFACTR